MNVLTYFDFDAIVGGAVRCPVWRILTNWLAWLGGIDDFEEVLEAGLEGVSACPTVYEIPDFLADVVSLDVLWVEELEGWVDAHLSGLTLPWKDVGHPADGDWDGARSGHQLNYILLTFQNQGSG